MNDVTRVLCHPGGAFFADYSTATTKSGKVAYALYITHEDKPPTAADLGITSAGMSRPEDLVWFPIRAESFRPAEFEEVLDSLGDDIDYGDDTDYEDEYEDEFDTDGYGMGV